MPWKSTLTAKNKIIEDRKQGGFFARQRDLFTVRIMLVPAQMLSRDFNWVLS